MAMNQSIKHLQLLNPPKDLQDFTYGDDEVTDIFNFSVRHIEFTGISVSFCFNNYHRHYHYY